jgi:hypothetical protein
MFWFLIMSCGRDRGNGVNAACRQTWLEAFPANYKFFLGTNNICPAEDEIVVAAPDDYGALQEKQVAAYRWALAHHAYYVFVCFTDTYVCPPRLFQDLPHRVDLMGLQVKHGAQHVSGGAGYWLSRRALQAIVLAPRLPDKQGDEHDWKVCNDARLPIVFTDKIGSYSTRHLSKSTGHYDPRWMLATHEALQRGEW